MNLVPSQRAIENAVGAAPHPILRLSAVGKSFGDRSVFASVNLDVTSGSAIALIGANGAGKSTLLNSIVRLVEPTTGRIFALGKDVTAMNAADLKAFRSRVGVVFQRHNLVGRLSALTNVVHGVQSRAHGPRTWLQSLAHEDVRQEALDCLAAVGLEDRAFQRADSLSGGQSQRVAIARMLMQRPELVLADEPDASLDPRSGEEIMSLLYRLTKDKGLTLVVISHRVEHTIHYSDRIIGLENGGISLDVASRDTSPAQLLAFFGTAD